MQIHFALKMGSLQKVAAPAVGMHDVKTHTKRAGRLAALADASCDEMAAAFASRSKMFAIRRQSQKGAGLL